MSSSSSAVKNAGKIFRPWDSENTTCTKTLKEELADVGTEREKNLKEGRLKCADDLLKEDRLKDEFQEDIRLKDWRVPPTEWSEALEAYWTSWAGEISSLTPKSTSKNRPKRFRCPHCDVAFSNNGQLKGHVRIHTGERPYKCEASGCGKSFTRNEELTRHKRIHSGVRPFSCSECGKSFGRKDHLKKHARTHLPAYAEIPPSFYVYPYLFSY